MEGTVKNIDPRGFGFIVVPKQQDIFFHCSKISDDQLAFDETLIERRVQFDIVQTAKGPQAANLRPAI